MRRLVLCLAVTATLAMTAGSATAANRYRGYRHPAYYGPRPAYNTHRGHEYGYGYGYRSDAFGEAARQVRAAHSRYRYNTHPRSYYNSPPNRYDTWRW